MGTRYSENFTEVHTSGFGVTATLSWPGSWEEILTGVAFTDYLRFGALAMERQGFIHMRVLYMISTLNFISSRNISKGKSYAILPEYHYYFNTQQRFRSYYGQEAVLCP